MFNCVELYENHKQQIYNLKHCFPIMSDSKNPNDCFECAEKINGTTKLNFSCGHIYCNKCIDGIILKTNDSNQPVCPHCSQNIEEGNNDKCCTKCYKTCNEFCINCNSCAKIYFCNIDFEEFGTILMACFFLIMYIFGIIAIIIGIIALKEHHYEYIEYAFILTSVIYNTIFYMILTRTFFAINDFDQDHFFPLMVSYGILLLIHLALLVLGSYSLSQNFSHNNPIILLLTSTCANITTCLASCYVFYTVPS